ncbi:hypothetical protein GE107_02535 [Cohnella sp. CFH 77786]|uniref:Hsp20/alpha crystallin family protein n=1 Tax=Cohnella sp. CFH 77786 TaxID=2662265 RepID=UPI001C60AB12|nr:Hsp20/alpha crystallin family protein [Cohnella sp. CFH 77786]MBW5444942.1 hypothetical protein [Cohnella sp. CFH 77786]
MNDRRHPAGNWREFQQNLLKQIPYVGGELHPRNIEKFVSKAIQTFMPKSSPFESGFRPFASSSLDCEIFETHRSVFVRCRVPDGLTSRDVRIWGNRSRLKIECQGRTEEVALPSDVNAGRAIAGWKDGVLEIRLPRIEGGEPFREIFIRQGGK